MSGDAEQDARSNLVATARAVFARGLSHGSTGNVSVRFGKTIMVTPTRSSMATVAPGELAVVDSGGATLGSAAPSKETPLHLAIYRRRPDIGAVVHTHSTYATAVSCLADIDPADVLPALTAYYAMRVKTLPLVGYSPPGDGRLAQQVGVLANDHDTMLLRNHGVVATAATLSGALEIAEEIERTAEIYLLLAGRKTSPISEEERSQLVTRAQ